MNANCDIYIFCSREIITNDVALIGYDALFACALSLRHTALVQIPFQGLAETTCTKIMRDKQCCGSPVLRLLLVADIHELPDDSSLPCATLQRRQCCIGSQVDDSSLWSPWARLGGDKEVMRITIISDPGIKILDPLKMFQIELPLKAVTSSFECSRSEARRTC